MPGFTPSRESATEEDFEVPVSSLTLAVGDMLELDIGATNWTVADSSTQHWQMKAVVSEAVTSATEVMVRFVKPGQLWDAESGSNSSASHNGDRMLLTDQNTVNNTGTDNTSQEAVFIQLGTISVAGDQRLLGTIVYGTGIDPDAA